MLRYTFLFFLILTSVLLSGQINRPIDGFGNNKMHPEWGSEGAQMPVVSSNGFADGLSLPGGKFRPNARLISNELFAQEDSINDKRKLSEFVWVFGQFIDHDINLVQKSNNEVLPIKIPLNDAFFIPGSSMYLQRSDYDHKSGIDDARRYINEVTAFIDASNVYGSNDSRASWLRSFKEGKLKTSNNAYLPWNTIGYEFNSVKDHSAPTMDDDTGLANKLFVGGDVRANEHPLLIALHTLFLREHNRICEGLIELYPHWDDEVIYQFARKKVGAYLQSIVYYEWLPAMGIQLPQYESYDEINNPGISNVFSAAAFRLGHTLLRDDILRFNIDGDTLKQGNILLRDAFFNPTLIHLAGGIDPYLRGIASRSQQLVDTKLVNGVRNFLFGHPEAGGFDLAALNIMRGRDRGLPDYNTLRADFALEKYVSFEQISDDDKLLSSFNFLYGNINNIDPWVGMLAEKHLPDRMFGELLYTIIQKQFKYLRDADRYYFENDSYFDEEEIEEIKNTRLSDIIKRNTKIENLQENVFFLPPPLVEEAKGPSLAPVHMDAVVYPNPIIDKINISYFLIQDSEVILTIYNSLGQKVYENRYFGFKGKNSISTFPNLDIGVYNLVFGSPTVFSVFKIYKR